MTHAKELQKLSESRIRRLIGNEAYLLETIKILAEIRKNDHAVSQIAQALALGIIPEGGDGS